MKIGQKDTIVALATPPGIGAIHIIRMSGKETIDILKKVFLTKNGKYDLQKEKRLIGALVDIDYKNKSKKVIDQVVLHIYRSPNSYTGEDLVEINCHGSPYVVDQILKLLTKNGARMAEAGEFTRRAFLNGKIDLIQAESISDLIHAKAPATGEGCIENIFGRLSDKIKSLQEKIKKICAYLELDLDFAEEGIEIDRIKINEELKEIEQEISILKSSFKFGKILQEGFHVVIIGRPNVGKSSLMNRIIKYKRAIVTPIPGTTRDTIEEIINLGGYLVKLTDTAGLRNYQDPIEEEGIKKAKQKIKQADLLVIMLDASEELTQDDKEILHIANNYKNKEKIVILNKCDLPKKVKIEELIDKYFSSEYLEVSCKTGLGIKSLERAIIDKINSKKSNGVVITKYRYLTALKRAEQNIRQARKTLIANFSFEFIIFDLKEAMKHLGEITGEITNEEILNEIFSSFCIGK